MTATHTQISGPGAGTDVLPAGLPPWVLYKCRHALLVAMDGATRKLWRLVCKDTCQDVHESTRSMTKLDITATCPSPVLSASSHTSSVKLDITAMYPSPMLSASSHTPAVKLDIAAMYPSPMLSASSHISAVKLDITAMYPSPMLSASFHISAVKLDIAAMYPSPMLSASSHISAEAVHHGHVPFPGALRKLPYLISVGLKDLVPQHLLLHALPTTLPGLYISLHGPSHSIPYSESKVNLDSLPAGSALDNLAVQGGQIEGLSYLGVRCTALRTLTLVDVHVVQETEGRYSSPYLVGVESCTALRTLHLNQEDRVAVHDVAGLDLSHCASLEDVSALAMLSTLEVLSLHECGTVCDITPLGQLSNLQKLDLNSCFLIDDLAALGACLKLRDLDLTGCRGVTDLSPLGGCTALYSLDVKHCDSLSDVSALSACVNLVKLRLPSRIKSGAVNSCQ
eukprot:gene29566-5916_t